MHEPEFDDAVDQLIRSMNRGEAGARDALFVAVYPELRKLARARLHEGGRNTVLDTTALVSESYLRFLKVDVLRRDDRRAFFAYASQVMRTIIIDEVRKRQTERRGGDLQRLTLDTQIADELPATEDEVLDIDAALARLAQAEPKLAQVVEMRYFGGCTEVETAETLGVDERTVRRYWQKARLLLAVLVKDGAEPVRAGSCRPVTG